MIRIAKSDSVPASLSRTSAYDGEDVLKQLIDDQHGKCYICERIRYTDFEVEHFESKSNNPKSRQEWRNLFLACRYCNGKKSARFDNMLNPVEVNIEDEIKQDIDFINGVAMFLPINDTKQSNKTVSLLKSAFNGKKRIRTIKEKQFFDYFISVMNRFQDLVLNYLFNPAIENEENVRNELTIDKEFLGFKYWIVKENDMLAKVFKDDIIWNKF